MSASVSVIQQKVVDGGITSLWVSDGEGNRRIPAETVGLSEFGDSPSTSEEVLMRVQNGLAEEAQLMLDENVVTTAHDIDLCMLGGAGWPLHLGGITPYLDRTGAPQRVNGRLFHPASGLGTGAELLY